MRFNNKFILVCTLVLFSAVACAEEEKHGFGTWPLWALLLFALVTLSLTAMYCGLTIGLLGLDTINLEIIAEAGPAPDCEYAKKILPIRKMGHHLLATLLLGNMLTLVLTSQLIAAIVNKSELVNFIVSTLVVLVFGEILPMSICNNGKYALMIGAKSLPALKLSIIALYVIAKPLGMILDCLISHDAGQLYDRNEFKKLIRVHFEKYSEKSGLDALQAKMIVNALDSNERTVGQSMTPMDKTFMLEESSVLDRQLERKLWEFGKSRVPVYSGERNNIVGVLYVRDLICVSVLCREVTQTVGQFIRENPRDLFVVGENLKLQQSLQFFENYRTQLLFVQPARSTPVEKEEEEPLTPLIISPDKLMDKKKTSELKEFIGILTLEDIIEDLIAEEIYDEDEHVVFDETNSDDNGAALDRFMGAVPKEVPRVNFYSYSISAGETKDNFAPLSDDQKWTLAHYMSRTFVFFASWKLIEIKFLLDEIGERVTWVDEAGVATGEVELYTSGKPSPTFTLLLGGLCAA
ncbi:hypothetical protein AGDE_04072 [Angomonas deanei]|nr:hypothetical protein AGDE_04072 [Angomonas deanei]|eukprot:EPY39856.1 hypothetical protein AGDE_04072 [Angomonas deanei]